MTTDSDEVENLLRTRLESQGQRLLAELAAGLEGARRYATPFGARARTPELVRAAIAALRDPARRLVHEWWARGLEPTS